MTVPTGVSAWGPYLGNNVATVFSYGGRIFSKADLIVTQKDVASDIEVILNPNTYTVSNINDVNGGFVTLASPLLIGYSLTIKRVVSLLQLTDIRNQGAFHAEIHEDVFDRLAMVDQQIVQTQNEFPVFPRSEPGKFLIWKSPNSSKQFESVAGTPTAPQFYTAPHFNAVLRTVESRLSDYLSILDFGVIQGDSSNAVTLANTLAINAALDTGKAIYVPPGITYISGNLVCDTDGVELFGAGWNSKIISTNTVAAMIVIAGGTTHIKVHDLYLGRNVTAAQDANGINVVNNLAQCTLFNLYIENQWTGVNLGPTDFSMFHDSTVAHCYNNGIQLINSATEAACQWSMKNVSSFQNNGHGFFIASVSGPPQMTLGTFEQLTTFANSGNGITVIGLLGVPIQGFRLIGGFIGGDGDHEIAFDSFGEQHTIRDVFMEGAGVAPTGRTLAVPASNIGSGLAISANNGWISIDGCHASSNSLNGFVSGATHTLFTGNIARNNGLALSSGNQNGFLIIGGSATLTGNKSGNTLGGGGQVDGIRSDVDDVLVVANDLRDNLSAGFNQIVPVVNSVVANNRV